MKKSRLIIYGALIAAAYAALSLTTVAVNFGPFQFRIAEALTVLPFFTPAAIPGLFVGCIIANLFSPFGIVDIIFGSLASLLAAFSTFFIGAYVKKRSIAIALAPLPPVIFNALIIGAVLTVMLAPGEAIAFWTFALEIGVSQFVVCYLIGIPLLLGLRKFFRKEA